MASVLKGATLNGTGAAYTALGTDTTRRDVEVSVTLAAYVVTDAADASAAATAASAGNYFAVPANVVVRLDNVSPATTWIRSQSATSAVYTVKWFQPS